MANTDKNWEGRVRRLARRRGYVLRKSRARKHWTMNNQGQFLVFHANRNLVVLGERFDATLDDIERLFSFREAA
jgi:hypothetical protein